MTDRLLNTPTFAHKVKMRTALGGAGSVSRAPGRVGRSNSGFTIGPSNHMGERQMSYNEFDYDRRNSNINSKIYRDNNRQAPWIMSRQNST